MTCVKSPVENCLDLDLEDVGRCMICRVGFFDDGQNRCLKSPEGFYQRRVSLLVGKLVEK